MVALVGLAVAALVDAVFRHRVGLMEDAVAPLMCMALEVIWDAVPMAVVVAVVAVLAVMAARARVLLAVPVVPVVAVLAVMAHKVHHHIMAPLEQVADSQVVLVVLVALAAQVLAEFLVLWDALDML